MTVDEMLPAIVLTWAVKSVILRYGGLQAHRKALPPFFGLVVGASITYLARLAVSELLGVPK